MLSADQSAARARYCALLKRQGRAAGHEVIVPSRPLLDRLRAWVDAIRS
jgi:hypothetical protein